MQLSAALCVTLVLGRDSLRAWLVTWEWAGKEAAVVDKVAMILDPRLSRQSVARIVELLYTHTTSGLGSLASYVKRASRIPYRAETDGSSRLDCGHNPWLHAEIVSKLQVVEDSGTGLETVTWVSQPMYKRINGVTKQLRKGVVRSFTRFVTGPPSHELRWDPARGSFKDGFDDRDA